MIRKILNKYFYHILASIIERYLVGTYNCDFKIEYKKGFLLVYAKKRKWKDNEYKQIYNIYYTEFIYSIANIEKTLEHINKMYKIFCEYGKDN